MQKLAPVLQDRNPNGHTDAEVLDALYGLSGTRRFSFRYELLDKNNVYVQDLERTVIDFSVSQNWLADIKRTAKGTVRDTGEIDFLSDRIKPYIRTHLPPYGPDDWVEHPQGVFLMITPERGINERGLVSRYVEFMDQLQVYSDDLVETRYTAATGASYVTLINALLGAVPKVVTPSTKTLVAAREWDPGTSKLKIINDLLNALNYESLSFDSEGRAVVQPYRTADVRAEEFVYGTDFKGLIVPNVKQEFDLFSVHNKWVMTVSDPDRPVLTASYTNADPASPTSTIRRGRTITDYRTEQDAADQAALNDKVKRLAFEASQVFEAIPFETAMMPIHEGNDVYRIQYPALAINARYVEQSWELEFKAGANMKHRARRVVTV